MSNLTEIQHLGPRTLYSYIRERFKQLNSLEERQKSLINAYLTTPDPARQTTPVPVLSHPAVVKSANVGQGSYIRGGPIRPGSGLRSYHHYRQPLQKSDIERHNLHYIRLEYYYAMVALKDLVTQVPDAQIDIRRRYLRHILIRLDQVLDRIHFEQGESNTVVAGTGGVGGGAQYRQSMMRHREMMNRFTTLFKELAHKYRN
ncbi:MAG: hypothetical protein J3R72DRAFT_444341 [Linnemannia gamsii]|nr:MAG: hypothetical protein J3R72DRAFT_444341 [Linnemannia gamsii]